MKVFVYGTLKTSESRNEMLKINGGKYVENYALRGYTIYDLPYGFPCIVESEDKNDYVLGEVWEVDDFTILQLDILENEGIMYSRTLYKRDGESMYVYKWIGELPDEAKECREHFWSSEVFIQHFVMEDKYNENFVWGNDN